ncbi:H-NS histone family protein [Comamonas sp. NoAH]|uniref:H-NS histone family protein n=1 Tax=Comamonas halotolerans TaxID=3041496 RepID=UPI0024E12B90|nr:H-NS histone family protein [Comamonas sp. NoAH]
MSSYKDLLKQRDDLEKQIQEARKRELAEAVGKVRALIEEHGLSAEDVFPPARSSRGANAGTKVAPKYKNPETGETWTGRGKAPKWIQDQDRSKFEI